MGSVLRPRSVNVAWGRGEESVTVNLMCQFGHRVSRLNIIRLCP